MNTHRRRRIDVVLDAEFVDGLGDLPIDQLRDRRVLTDEVEVELSYHRRLLQGRLDLLDFELRRRRGEESRSLIEALPEILTGSDTTGGGRGSQVRGGFAPEIPAVTGRRDIDRVLEDTFLAELPATGDEELLAIRDLMAEAERNVSDVRRQVHDVHDRIVAAIADRYVGDRSD